MRNTFAIGSRRYRHAFVGMIAVTIALAGFALVSRDQNKSPAAHAILPMPIVIFAAARPIKAGTVIALPDLAQKTAKQDVPGAATTREALLGRVSARDYQTGDILLPGELRDAASMGIASHVTPGERAFAIRVAEDDIVGGFLQGGDRVDVIATIPGTAFPARDSQNLPDRSQAVLLLQNVLVLAVGETIETKGTVQAAARTVSLSLAPDQLARLALALRFGKVSVAIRNPGDAALGLATTATLKDIAKIIPPPSHSAPKRAAGIPFFVGQHVTSLVRSAAP